jgi:hypothetical protein
MIATLAEAWAWYEAVHDLADWMDRIAHRNWVAHGRRGDAENEVTPGQSRECLKRFLDLLESWEPETPDAA